MEWECEWNEKWKRFGMYCNSLNFHLIKKSAVFLCHSESLIPWIASYSSVFSFLVCLNYSVNFPFKTDGWMDGWTGMYAGRQRDRWTDRQVGRHRHLHCTVYVTRLLVKQCSIYHPVLDTRWCQATLHHSWSSVGYSSAFRRIHRQSVLCLVWCTNWVEAVEM